MTNKLVIVTDCDYILNNEIAIFENLIQRSTTLLEKLNDNPKHDEFLKHYLNILFGLRCAYTDYRAIQETMDNIYKGKQRIVNIFLFQKTLKDFFSNIDSTLDYLKEFSVKWQTEMKHQSLKTEFIFSRERTIFPFDEKINKFRNIILHEGKLIIFIDKYEVGSHGCIHYTSYEEVKGSIQILVKGEKDPEETNQLTDNIYKQVKGLIEKYTEIIISELK